MHYRPFVVFCASYFIFCFPVYGSESDSFIVEVSGEHSGVQSENKPFKQVVPGLDVGEQLKSINGVSASRKGGKGFEPVIRGQQQSQLNILLDNAQILGACPGRMDPPTSYVTMAGYDRVRVIKGYESVIYGSGGSGGSILFERDVPAFGENDYTVKMGGGYRGNDRGNGHSSSTQADVALGSEEGYFRTYGAYNHSGNYQDGDGNDVSSAFRSASGGLVLAGRVLEGLYVDASVESTRDRDIWYAGNNMDAPYANSDLWRLKLNVDQSMGWIDEQELSLYYSDVHHLMDNYSVRRRTTNSTATRAPSSSRTQGGRWLGTLYSGDSEWQIGIDYFTNKRDASRYKIDLADSQQTQSAHMWPGVEYNQWGAFAEVDHTLSEKNLIRSGVRVDQLSANAGKANDAALGAASPHELYKKYYGYQAESVQETNISGLLSWQHKMANDQWIEVRGSRSVRTADATERYLASRGSCCHGSDDWVGNPQIKPEKHHQIDVGYHYSRYGVHASSVVYWDEVSDYILRHQSNEGPYLYKNTDARIYGVEFEAHVESDAWKPSLSLNWTRGVNKSATGQTDENLPQIPALLAVVSLDYDVQRWGLGSRCEFAARQDKVNVSSGLDAGASSGFGVCHLSGHYHITSQAKLRGGIENLFNKAYAWHINKRSRDPFNPDATVINEPGRTVWVGVDVSF